MLNFPLAIGIEAKTFDDFMVVALKSCRALRKFLVISRQVTDFVPEIVTPL
jgi:hypothetical protein